MDKLFLKVIFLLFIVIGNQIISSQEIKPRYNNKDEIKLINKLGALLDTKLEDNEIKFLKAQIDSPFFPAKVLSTVMLYKRNQKEYKDILFKIFAVHDYVERSKGKYDLVEYQKIMIVIQEIETNNAKIEDKIIFLLLLFEHYKNQNKWIKMGEKKISAARFFRSSFLAGVFKDTQINVVELTYEIDRYTEKEDLREIQSD